MKTRGFVDLAILLVCSVSFLLILGCGGDDEPKQEVLKENEQKPKENTSGSVGDTLSNGFYEVTLEDNLISRSDHHTYTTVVIRNIGDDRVAKIDSSNFLLLSEDQKTFETKFKTLEGSSTLSKGSHVKGEVRLSNRLKFLILPTFTFQAFLNAETGETVGKPIVFHLQSRPSLIVIHWAPYKRNIAGNLRRVFPSQGKSLEVIFNRPMKQASISLSRKDLKGETSFSRDKKSLIWTRTDNVERKLWGESIKVTVEGESEDSIRILDFEYYKW